LAEAYLTFLGKCMNTFCVSMMMDADRSEPPTPSTSAAIWRHHNGASGDSARAQAKSPLLASERALVGYCAFHHLLLAFCERFPEMVCAADRMVDAVVAGKADKQVVPDLGVMLAVLTVSSRSWADTAVAWAVLGESLCRNVRWVIKGMPHIAAGMPAAQTEQQLRGELRDWWAHSLTSRRVLMFQTLFVTKFGRPNGVHRTKVSPPEHKYGDRNSELTGIYLRF
jgi:hypothetical protein